MSDNQENIMLGYSMGLLVDSDRTLQLWDGISAHNWNIIPFSKR